jgi:hypothetical protein
MNSVYEGRLVLDFSNCPKNKKGVVAIIPEIKIRKDPIFIRAAFNISINKGAY